ncbi:MAG: hypothetical protein R3301_11550 [Saprospiraceae bacterium]|nr:hypothetical protein [Saprospiraceae bacterium]
MKYRTHILICFLSFAQLMACKEEPPVKEGSCDTITLGVPFDARIHETWCLDNGSLAITFGRILDDSRCNIQDVECVWAGKFTMEVDINEQGILRRDTFDAIHNWQDTLATALYDIALIKVFPETRVMNNLPDTSDYVLRIVVE